MKGLEFLPGFPIAIGYKAKTHVIDSNKYFVKIDLKKGGKMKKQKIKPLPVVKAFTDYFIRKAKRALRLKKADFDRVEIDWHMRGTIWVWFFKDKKVVNKIVYNVDGKKSW